MLIQFNEKNQRGGKPTREERTNYLNLCNQLTSRNQEINYPLISSHILEFLHKDVMFDISVLPQKQEMLTDVKAIFDSIDASDTNFIGKVNIVSLQCVMMFSEYSIDHEKGAPADPDRDYKVYLELRKCNWRNYSELVKALENTSDETIKKLYWVNRDSSSKSYTPYGINEDKHVPIFIIIKLKFITLTEFLKGFLNKVCYCGITSALTLTDGNELIPFQFTRHDILHGEYYEMFCYKTQEIDLDDLRAFYTYSQENPNPAERYPVSLMLFLLMHETRCGYFPSKHDLGKGPRKQWRTSHYTIDYINEILFGSIGITKERITNLGDLGMSIPEGSRGDPETYIQEAISIYCRKLQDWITSIKPESPAGGHRQTKKRRNRTKKYKNLSNSRLKSINILK